ncbi:hypothetical protein M758_8G020000 [Ceratodon purpureus]|uniref:Uncharacterized protein n=1 Tax=Ceratodon purpureus TaxID=3225 RepID=A0A8T0H2H5_CERPU|nr:hypothetical protein KC19_8G020800 [Ceratodon purpureus]KAG0607327.1 hypothetical protein M758_8G020000 [Ceratodon purpureus]
MEPDDIGVVMSRASELHSSICDAIDRVTQSRFLGNGSLHVFGDEEDELPGSSTEEEVRSLEGIRDALEVLETQLESLQSVQQQQRIRKDAALAELEESRRVLLLRLKEHDGREMQVVEEAMTFAGEPVKKTDDLPLPPYLHPVSPSLYSESPVFRTSKAQEKPNLARQLDEHRRSFNSSLFLVDESPSTDAEHQPPIPTHINTVTPLPRTESLHLDHSTTPPPNRLSRALTGLLSFTGKSLLVAVSVVAFLAVSEFNLNRRQKAPKDPMEEVKPTPRPPPQAEKQPNSEMEVEAKPRAVAPILECPAGYKRIEDDGIVKCIVKERVELPFPRGISTPDVLHGRG